MKNKSKPYAWKLLGIFWFVVSVDEGYIPSVSLTPLHLLPPLPQIHLPPLHSLKNKPVEFSIKFFLYLP